MDGPHTAPSYVLPEVTRGLRTLGLPHGALQAAHDAWFAPALAARRASVHITDPLQQVQIFDAARLTADVHGVIAQLAVVRAPDQAALRRAVEAALEDAAEPAFRALDQLALLADTVQHASDAARPAAWHRWVEGLRQLFVALDEGWALAAPIVEREPTGP